MTTTMSEPADPLAALNAALARAQGEFKPVPRDKEVKTGSYAFRYAELGTILETIRPVLSKHGIAVIQPLDDGAIITELRHEGGGVISARFPLPTVPANPQQLGSLITYLRRYCLVSLLGIATEDDDDGNQAAQTPAKPKRITDSQRRRLFAIASEHGIDETRLRAIINTHTGDTSTSSIPDDGTYDLIVAAVEDDNNVPF